MQETRVQSPVWEGSTCHEATTPAHHNYLACALQQEKLPHKKLAHHDQRKPMHSNKDPAQPERKEGRKEEKGLETSSGTKELSHDFWSLPLQSSLSLWDSLSPLLVTLGWQKNLFRFFCKMVWKNPLEHFGQPNSWDGGWLMSPYLFCLRNQLLES